MALGFDAWGGPGSRCVCRLARCFSATNACYFILIVSSGYLSRGTRCQTPPPGRVSASLRVGTDVCVCALAWILYAPVPQEVQPREGGLRELAVPSAVGIAVRRGRGSGSSRPPGRPPSSFGTPQFPELWETAAAEPLHCGFFFFLRWIDVKEMQRERTGRIMRERT